MWTLAASGAQGFRNENSLWFKMRIVSPFFPSTSVRSLRRKSVICSTLHPSKTSCLESTSKVRNHQQQLTSQLAFELPAHVLPIKADLQYEREKLK